MLRNVIVDLSLFDLNIIAGLNPIQNAVVCFFVTSHPRLPIAPVQTTTLTRLLLRGLALVILVAAFALDGAAA